MKKLIKRVLKFVKKNMLLCLLVFFCAGMWLYGFMLKQAGYMLIGEGANQPLIALAFNKMSEGIYPWNMNANKVDDYGFVETIQLDGAAFASTSDNKPVSDAAKENAKAVGTSSNSNGNSKDTEHSEYTIGPVPIGYFDDAAFIGDSRMEGVYEYAKLDNATFLTKVSMSIYTLMDSKVSNPDYKTVLEGLTDKQYGKIYIMVGINEIGTATTEYFVAHYLDVINQIKELQPDAIIIIHAIMHVTASRDETDEYFNNTNINERNEALKALANGVDIFYIDVNPLYDDENGNLIEEYSSDNIHLYGNRYVKWREFLFANGIYKSDIDPFKYYKSTSANEVQTDENASENESNDKLEDSAEDTLDDTIDDAKEN